MAYYDRAHTPEGKKHLHFIWKSKLSNNMQFGAYVIYTHWPLY